MDVQTELPMEIKDKFWICSDIKSSQHIDVGKWMLYYDKKFLNERWSYALKLFNNGELGDVICLKCSTAAENLRASTKKDGVIIFYCNFSENEQKILDIGRIIINKMKYKGSKIYYKTDKQTHAGTRATGQTKNYLYSLDISDDVCRILPPKKELLKYPMRYNNSFFESLQKFKDNPKKMEKYNKWKSGFNFKTNRKIKIGGELYMKLRNSFEIKYFTDGKENRIYFDEIENLDIETYQKDTEKILNEIKCENEKIEEYNNLLVDLEDKISRLENYEDFVLFDGIKYGNVNAIREMKDCISLPKTCYQHFHSETIKQNVEKKFGKNTKH